MKQKQHMPARPNRLNGFSSTTALCLKPWFLQLMSSGYFYLLETDELMSKYHTGTLSVFLLECFFLL